MQRQPTPRADPLRKGHFLRRGEALKEAGINKHALTDLADLPSSKGDKTKADAKKRANRDIAVAKQRTSRVGIRRKFGHF